MQFHLQGAVADEVLALWEGGYSRNGVGGFVEGFVELGPDTTAQEVERETDQVRAIFGQAREQVGFTYRATSLDEVPWINENFVPGCTATVPTRSGGTATERLVEIGVSYTKDSEFLDVQVTAKDPILQTQERILNAIRGR